MLDISEYSKDLDSVKEIVLREHISKAYELSEILDWCDPGEDLDIHKRTMSKKDGRGNKEAIVPVISSNFEKHEDAQSAYTELQRATNKVNVDVYDVHYEKDNCTIGVVLDPFEV